MAFSADINYTRIRNERGDDDMKVKVSWKLSVMCNAIAYQTRWQTEGAGPVGEQKEITRGAIADEAFFG